jgi:hypothetical protein
MRGANVELLIDSRRGFGMRARRKALFFQIGIQRRTERLATPPTFPATPG